MNQLLRKTGIYFIGNLASKATFVLMIPIYAVFVAPAALGLFDYYQTLMTLIAPLVFLAIWESVLRFMIRIDCLEDFSVALSTVVALVLISISVIVIVGIAFSLIAPAYSSALIAICAMSIVYGCAQVWQFLVRASKNVSLYSFSGVIGALVNFFLILIFVCAARMELFGLCASFVGGQFVIICLIEIKMRFLRQIHLKDFSAVLAKQFVKYAIPLAVNLVLGAISVGFGRLFITNIFGPDANGVYAFAMKFGAIVTAIGSIFAMAVIEEVVLRIGKEDFESFLESVMNSSYLLLASLSSCFMPLISVFYSLFISGDYAQSLCLVPCFLLYGMANVLSALANCAFQATQTTHVVAVFSLIGAIVTSSLTLVLSGALGLFGVAISLALGYSIVFALGYFIGRHKVRYTIRLKVFFPITLVFLLSFAINSYFALSSNLWGELIWSGVSCAALLPIIVKSINSLRKIPNSK